MIRATPGPRITLFSTRQQCRQTALWHRSRTDRRRTGWSRTGLSRA